MSALFPIDYAGPLHLRDRLTLIGPPFIKNLGAFDGNDSSSLLALLIPTCSILIPPQHLADAASLCMFIGTERSTTMTALSRGAGEGRHP